MSDPSWALASWTEDFVDIEGDAKPGPRYRTRAKMLWDDECFYVAAEMEEPHLWATYAEHDSIVFHEHDFEVFIDPDGDNHDYFEIEINALGTVFDLRLVKPYRDGGPALHDWDAVGLRSAIGLRGTLNDPSDVDDGWTVELAIPWTCMAENAGCRVPPEVGDVWRVNFSRVEWLLDVVDGTYRKRTDCPEDNWVWSPQGAIDMHRPEMWGYVAFVDGPGECRIDPDHATRMRLMELYWAQRRYWDSQGRWAAVLEGFEDATIELTSEGYLAYLAGLTIREDSKMFRSRDG